MTKNRNDVPLEYHYGKVKNWTASEFPQHVQIVVDMFDETEYSHLNYLELTQIGGRIKCIGEVNFFLHQWKEEMNVINFSKLLRYAMFEEYDVSSSCKELFEESLIHLRFRLPTNPDESLEQAVNRFVASLKRIHERLLADQAAATLKHQKEEGYPQLAIV